MLKKISIYIIGLLPLALVAGPFVGELFLFVLFILFSYYFSKDKPLHLIDNNLFKIFILFWIYIVTLSIFASEISISLKSSFFYLRFGLYTLAIIYFLNIVQNSTKIIYSLYKYTFIFVIVDSIIQVFFGADLFGLKPNNENLMRISGPFGDKYILGSFLQKILPVFIYFVLKIYQLEKRIKLSDIIIIIFTFVMIYRSGDRSAFGLIILFSFIFFIINGNLRKKMLAILTLFVIISSLFTLQNPKIFERNFYDTINQFKGKYYEKFLIKDISETKLNFMIFSFHHQSHYSTALRMFLDKPIVGHGVKMFRYECKNFQYVPTVDIKKSFLEGYKYSKSLVATREARNAYGCSTHPHNTYLQFLAETGLVGFLFVFIIFLYLGYKIINYFKKDSNKFYPESALLIGIFINFWPIIPTGNFFNNWISMIYFIPISYYLYEIKYKKK